MLKIISLLFFITSSVYLFSQEKLIKDIELLDDSLQMNISNVRKQEIYDKALLKLKSNHNHPKLERFYFDYTLNAGYNRVQTENVNDSIISSVKFALKELKGSKLYRSDSLVFRYNLLVSYLNIALGNLESSKKLLKNMLNSQRISTNQKSSVFSELSFLYSIENNLDSSVFFIKKALDIDRFTQDRKRMILDFYTLGEVYLQHKKYFEAYLSYQKAIVLCKVEHKKIKSSINNRIAVIYNDLGDYHLALFFSKKAMSYSGKDYFLTSEIHCDIAGYYAKLNNWDSCYHYTNKIIRSKQENRFSFNTRAYLYRYLYLISNNKEQEAKLALEEARKHNKTTEKDYFEALINFFYAKEFFKQKKIKIADEFIIKAMRYDFRNAQNTEFVDKKEIYQLAAQIKSELGDYKASNLYLLNLLDIQNSSRKYEIKSNINKMNFRYQIKLQKEGFLRQKDEALKSEKKYIIIVLSASFFIILNLIYLTSLRVRGRTNKLLQLKQQFSQSQIAPHFISNALVSVQKMILEKKSIEASDVVSDFSVLASLLLQNIRETNVKLSKEILFIQKYMDFQQLRKNNFSYTIKLDDAISCENILIPPLITQPFIENAIEHAFNNSNVHGELLIEYCLNSKFILISISDNGAGIEDKELNKTYSYSYKIIRERIKLFNELQKKAEFELELKSELNKGTKVFIKIPYVRLVIH